MNTKKLVRRFEVAPGAKVNLGRDYDPADTAGIKKSARVSQLLEEGLLRLTQQQDKLYAQNSQGLLVILQALDAAGKDSAIKHVMSGVNPQGCQVYSFKAPSQEELDHDYLWRTFRALPERGRIGIFNRSYYEEVLVVRVHPEILARQALPSRDTGHGVWMRRFEEINAFERYLTDNGFQIVKIFLYVSRAEQKKRFLERIEQPDKNWKFSLDDVHERAHWDEYMAAYEEVFTHTSAAHAPWYVVPADHKWFTRLAVSAIIGERLDQMDPQYPTVSEAQRRDLATARQLLAEEDA